MSRFTANSTMIPNAFLDEVMLGLSDKALRTYLVIVRKTTGWGKQWDSISLSQFQLFTGIKDERTVRTGLKELINLGLINASQKIGRPTRYSLVIGNEAQDVPPAQDAPPTQDDRGPLTSHVPDPLHGMSPTKETNTKETNKRKEIYPFDDFYSIYPKKVDKAKAKKVWDKLSDDKRIMAINDVPNRTANHEQWRDKQFITNPATYLNGARWEDDIIQTQKNQHTSHSNTGPLKTLGTNYAANNSNYQESRTNHNKRVGADISSRHATAIAAALADGTF